MKLAVVALLGMVGIAHAEDPEPVGDDAWDQYDAAFVQIALGHDRGIRQLDALVDQYPAHPASLRARGLLGRDAAMHDRRIARAELVLGQTLGGLATGAIVCSAVNCTDQRTTASVFAATVAGQFAITYAASEDVEEGEAHLYNSAGIWGLWNGAALTDRTASSTVHALMLIGSEGAGLAAAYGLWHTWRPSEGDVALTNSALLWSTVLYLWVDVARNQSPVLHDVVIAGDVGLVLGGLTSTRWHLSRGRTLLLDTGGLLGILGGGLAAAISNGGDVAIGASLFAGTAVGLASAAYLSRDWDHPATVAPTPIAGPASQGVGVSAMFRF